VLGDITQEREVRKRRRLKKSVQQNNKLLLGRRMQNESGL